MGEPQPLQIPLETLDRLKRMARADKVSALELLGRLVEREEQARLRKAMHGGYEPAGDDPSSDFKAENGMSWAQFKAEAGIRNPASGELTQGFGDVLGALGG